MYGLYQKEQTGERSRYLFVEETSLFGCNVGWIPRLLRPLIPANPDLPWTWRIEVTKALAQAGKPSHTLIINLKPSDTNLSLYELINVWGYTEPTWTPIMMHLRGLFEDESPTGIDTKDFLRIESDITDPIFSMSYLIGSISNGALSGRWTPPGKSSTNSVVLGTETFRYFIQEAQKLHPALAETRKEDRLLF